MIKQEFLAKKEKQNTIHSTANEWITVEELQDKLKISRATVYRWIKKGALRAYRLKSSRNIYFINAEVDHFISLNPIAPSGRLDILGQAIYGELDKKAQ